MRFGTWNVRNLYRAGSITAAARELARYKLDLVGVKRLGWYREVTVRAVDYNLFVGKEMKIVIWQQDTLYKTE